MELLLGCSSPTDEMYSRPRNDLGVCCVDWLGLAPNALTRSREHLRPGPSAAGSDERKDPPPSNRQPRPKQRRRGHRPEGMVAQFDNNSARADERLWPTDTTNPTRTG